MSQFASLSQNFRESIDDMAERIRMAKDQDVRVALARFVDGPVMSWYDALDSFSKSEVRRMLAEACLLSTDESAVLAKQAGVVSPMGLLDSMLVDEPGEQPMEISQES
jgi:hypothetical protein